MRTSTPTPGRLARRGPRPDAARTRTPPRRTARSPPARPSVELRRIGQTVALDANAAVGIGHQGRIGVCPMRCDRHLVQRALDPALPEVPVRRAAADGCALPAAGCRTPRRRPSAQYGGDPMSSARCPPGTGLAHGRCPFRPRVPTTDLCRRGRSRQRHAAPRRCASTRPTARRALLARGRPTAAACTGMAASQRPQPHHRRSPSVYTCRHALTTARDRRPAGDSCGPRAASSPQRVRHRLELPSPRRRSRELRRSTASARLMREERALPPTFWLPQEDG